MIDQRETGRVRQEEDRVPSRRIALALLVGAAVTVGLVLVTRQLFLAKDRSEPTPERDSLSPPREILHGLIAVESPAAHGAARAAETLATYGWVDRERRVVRIPMERAMELVVSGMNVAELTSGTTPRERRR